MIELLYRDGVGDDDEAAGEYIVGVEGLVRCQGIGCRIGGRR